MSDEPRQGDDGRTADERALAALFTSLVEDSPPSEVSPLEVIKLAKNEQRDALDHRIKRLKLVRNVFLAAAFAAVVALVFPHLLRSSSDTASTAGSSSSAPSAVKQPDTLVSGFAAAGGAGDASSAAAASGGSTVAAASSAASSEAVSAPASPAAAPSERSPNASSATAGRCALPPAKAVAAARAAFPAGFFGAAVQVDGCDGLYGARLTAGSENTATVTIVVTRAAEGTCLKAAACAPIAGTTDAFTGTTSARVRVVSVYGAGYQVSLTSSGGTAVSPSDLIAGGRAVLKALG